MKKITPCNQKSLKAKLMALLLCCLSIQAFSQVGTLCNNPIVIASLPYTTTDNTANYADNYDPDTDFWLPINGVEDEYANYYHGGNDVIYSYTPAVNTTINISIPNSVGWSGVFVYSSCSNIGVEAIGGDNTVGTATLQVNNLAVTAGQTYYILVSTWPAPQTMAYTLNIVDNNPCAGILAPGGSTTQTLNEGQTLADLTVTGTNLKWYSNVGLTTLIPNTTEAVNGTTYYVTQTVGTCTSTALSIVVTVVDPCAGVQAPEGENEQELLLGQTLAGLDVDGDNLTWYSDEELTTEIPDTTEAIDGTTYYVTQTVGNCISPALDITVTVTDPCAGILAPDGEDAQELLLGQTLADLDVEGDNLTWYSDEELTTVIPDTTVAEDGEIYYVTQTVGNCISPALDITVTVTDPCSGTMAPEAEENQDFTEGETLADLDVTGDNLTWYADEELTQTLPDTTVLTDDTTYYVTQTINTCMSPYTAITVNEIMGVDSFNTSAFKFSPNPVSGVLNLSYNEDIKSVSIFNMLGQQVFFTAVNASEASINLSELSAGNYLLRAETGNSQKTVRIIKQ